MNRYVLLAPVSLLAAALAVAPALAQYGGAPATPSTFKDTSSFKPPAGSKVAIVEYEDLECPACAHAFPIVHAAAEHYKIPLIRRDFPLQQHVWSFDGAVIARYLQDKVSPKVADEYRGAVFAAQISIASKDDLANFTRRFFQSHGLQMPFVVDPQGVFANEVRADYNLGQKLGLVHTPTIVVVTAKNWTEVEDVAQLNNMLEQALVSTKGAAASEKQVHPAARGAAKHGAHVAGVAHKS